MRITRYVPALLLVLAPLAQAKNLEDLGRETQIYAAYATTDALRPLGLSVSVDQGRVTLTGAVRTAEEKALAARVAEASSGLGAVDNRIEVDPRHVAALDPAVLEPPPAVEPLRQEMRAPGRWLRDIALVLRIKTQLLLRDVSEALDVDVDAHSGEIRLGGVADSDGGRAAAARIAAATPGVTRVDNRIALRPPPSRLPALDAPRASLADAWITARLKSSLLLSRMVDGQAIAVATSRGAVSLSGRVPTTEQREAAVEIARGIRGVRSVDASGLGLG